MRRILVLIAVLVNLSTYTCAQNIQNIHWLEGTWVQRKEAFVTTESWDIVNASLVGNSETKAHGKVVFTEVLRIHDTLNTTFYEARLPAKIGVFQLDSIGNNYVSFTDSSNDFPSKLSYIRKEDTLQVILEGTNQGNFAKETLNFLLLKN